MARTYDSPHGDNFEKAIRLSVDPRKRFPFRQDLTAILYDEDYVQRAEFFEPLPLDTPHPELEGVFLVNESNPTTRSDGLFRWVRTYASVPGSRTEFEMTGFTFPSYKTTSGSTENLRENFTRSVVAKVVYSYVHTTDPANDLTLSRMFSPVDSSSNEVDFVADDTTPTKESYSADVAAGTYIQSNETEVSRWQGNIWQQRNVFVQAL